MSVRPVPGLTAWTFRQLQSSPIIKEIETYNDRTAGIVAVTFLEDIIKDVLRGTLGNDEKAFDRFFGDKGPAGAFGAKIELAYMLRLFTKEGLRELNFVRKIRNTFAHEVMATDFEFQEIRNYCMELKIIEKWTHDGSTPVEEIPQWSLRIKDSKREALAVPRNRFLLSVNQYAFLINTLPAPYF